MGVEIVDFNLLFKDEIRLASNNELDWGGDWSYLNHDKGPLLYNSGEASLCGGENSEEFSKRLTAAIWDANKSFCKVNVVATFLEDLSYEQYELSEKDYNIFLEYKNELV